MKTQPKAAECSRSYSPRVRTGEASMEISHSQENPTSAQKADITSYSKAALFLSTWGPQTALRGLQMTPESSQPGDKGIMSPLWVAVFM